MKVSKKKLTVDEVLAQKVVKLDLGGGDHPAAGFVNVDIMDHPQVDLQLDLREFDQHFPARSVDGIMCRDTLQCFKHSEVKGILRQWHKALRPRSKFVLQCYDMDKVVEQYVNGEITKERFRKLMYGSQRTEHQVFVNCFDEKYLCNMLESIGFDIQEVTHPSGRIKIVTVKK